MHYIVHVQEYLQISLQVTMDIINSFFLLLVGVVFSLTITTTI